MVSLTIRAATGAVAATFWMHGRNSPLHIKGGVGKLAILRSSIKLLFQAFGAKGGTPSSQRAVPQELLQELAETAKVLGEVAQHTVDLIIGAYFFAMRACKFCLTKQKGQMKTLTLGNITLRDEHKRVVIKADPKLQEKSKFVTVCFVDQKNGRMMERQTPKKPGRKWMCPVKAWA